MIDFDVICNDRPHYGNGPHVHADDMLFVPLDGLFSVAAGGRSAVIADGAMWYVPGRSPHHVQASGRQRHLCYYADMASLDRQGFCEPRCWSMSTLLHDLMRLRRHFLPGRTNPLELSREALDRMIIAEVGRVVASRPADLATDEAGAMLSAVKAYIARHLDEDLSCAALADRFRLKERTLARWFGARERASVGQYVLEARLQEAARLLRTSALPVADIQEAVGFASPAHFSFAVRKRFGAPPSALRLKNHESDKSIMLAGMS
ncbi:helix-turn-helix domain-containing protein [Bordetella genomosp. 13]|uniref:AraC family transcriptional regulator n=1 Tax=Bordetella genomosp. 13 TaxID=463040 RepID=UPI0016425DA6|nr:AraC family transcriptional regulator [Bordetella genomosp. 13]